MERIDVAVIGLGAMGSAALWRLATRGVRVVGFEQFEPGHDRGSSHGESRLTRSAYFEDQRYVPLTQHAFALWRRLEEETGASLLTMTGCLMIGRPERRIVAGTLTSAREHGLAHDVLDATEMGRRYPQHRLSLDEVAVYEDMAGFLRPEAAITAAVQRAESLGAIVRRNTVVDGIDVVGDGVHIRVADGTHHARHAIVAVGSWLGPFFPGLNLPVQVERQVLAWFPTRDPALYSPARCPVYNHEPSPGHIRYGFPTLDGATVKVAVHHEGASTTAEDIDRTVHPRDLEPVQDFVRERLAAVEPVAVRSKVCMYTNTPDDHFIVGSPPGMPAVTLLGGFSGHGFKFASVIGDAAADMVVDGATDYPVELFSPLRFIPS